MKGWRALFFSIPFFLYANDFAPLIPPGPEFPVGLTEENVLMFEGPAALKREQERNVQILSSHAFPWLLIIIVIGLGGGLWAGYLMGVNHFFNLTDTRELDRKKIRHAFERLKRKEWKNDELKSYSTELAALFIETISHQLRHSLHHLTTDELKKVLESRSFLTKDGREALIKDLDVIDQIKFARRDPSIEELKSLTDRLKHLIDSNL